MRLTNIHWDGSESSISLPDYGEFEVRDRIAIIPDMAGVVLLYTREGEKHGFRVVEEVIEVQSPTEERAPVVAPFSDGADASGEPQETRENGAETPEANLSTDEATPDGDQPSPEADAAAYAEQSQPSGKGRPKKA